MTSVRLVGRSVIVSRPEGDLVISTHDAFLDFVGSGAERAALVAAWEQRPHVPHGTPYPKTPVGETPGDLALMASIEGGRRVARTQESRKRKLKKAGLLDAEGYVTEAGRETMERCGVNAFRQGA